jgi:hypothetical protein
MVMNEGEEEEEGGKKERNVKKERKELNESNGRVGAAILYKCRMRRVQPASSWKCD